MQGRTHLRKPGRRRDRLRAEAWWRLGQVRVQERAGQADGPGPGRDGHDGHGGHTHEEEISSAAEGLGSIQTIMERDSEGRI